LVAGNYWLLFACRHRRVQVTSGQSRVAEKGPEPDVQVFLAKTVQYSLSKSDFERGASAARSIAWYRLPEGCLGDIRGGAERLMQNGLC
jgi:hypothetical protein